MIRLFIIAVAFIVVAYNTKAEDEHWDSIEYRISLNSSIAVDDTSTSGKTRCPLSPTVICMDKEDVIAIARK